VEVRGVEPRSANVSAGISERSRQRASNIRNSDDEFPCVYPELCLAAWSRNPGRSVPLGDALT